jgi:hypothetical protein
VTRKSEKGFFERRGAGSQLECGRRIARQEAAGVNNGHAIGEKLDLGEGVRCEEQ